MNKILVLSTGWHFSSNFYENMIKQIVPKNWKLDYFCVAHRMPEDDNVIKEKNDIRNSEDENFLIQLDKMMYDYPITREQIEDFGWKFMLEDNTVGDMEVFNQWSEKYDYKEYDIICITHDDNLILSNNIFYDILKKDTKFYKPIKESRYGTNKHQFKVKFVKNEDNWLFLDNGYSENIPKAFEPRGSFCFYKKELIDLLPNNKFVMSERGKPILNRVGKTNSVGYDEISVWNSAAGTFRDFLYDKLPNLGLVEKTRWLSNTKRVSKYCIEGERGFISNYRADGLKYINDLKNQLGEIGCI
jgi:hypothetical protein